MKSLFPYLIIILIVDFAYAQTLSVEFDQVDPNNTWSWNWDIVADDKRLITVNENGNLYIKEAGIWTTIEIDPGNNDLEPRGVALADDGTIWITTLEHGLWQYNENAELINFTTANSSLPVDKLRRLDIHENFIWISTDDGLGLIRYNKETGESDHFTESNTPGIKSDFLLDPYIDQNGVCWFDNQVCLSSISPDLSMTAEDYRLYISGSGINDIFIVSPTEIWLAMRGGVILFDGVNYNIIKEDRFQRYDSVFKDSNGDLWLTYDEFSEDFLAVIRDGETYTFSREDIENIPSQTFQMTEYQDTVVAVGLLGNNVAKFVFEEPSSVSDITDLMVNVFPNPASNFVTITAASHLNILAKIYDVNGALILTDNDYNNTIEISHLNSGNYTLEFTDLYSKAKTTKALNITK